MFKFLHIIWAIAGVSASVMLLFSKGGHPPAIVLLPAVLVIWLLGHLVLWFSQWLVRRSSRSIFAEQSTRQRWPPAVVFLIVVTGVLAFAAVILSITLLVRTGTGNQFIVPASTALGSTLLFLGLLMRRKWAWIIVVLLLAGLTGWLVFQMGSSLLKGYQHPIRDWLIAGAMLVILTGLDFHLLKSKRVRGYFSTR